MSVAPSTPGMAVLISMPTPGIGMAILPSWSKAAISTMRLEVEVDDSAVEGGEVRGDLGDLGDLGGDLGGDLDGIGELLLKDFTHGCSSGLAAGAARPATRTLASVWPLGQGLEVLDGGQWWCSCSDVCVPISPLMASVMPE